MAKLLVYGSINWDTTIFVDKLPKAGEEVKVKSIKRLAGGKGGNTATAAARILNDVAILGALGNDDIANKHIEIFNKEGIDTNAIIRLDADSGQAYVIVDSKGENMIFTHKAANHMIKPEDLRNSKVMNAISNAEMLLIIDPSKDIASEIINIAYNMKKRIIFIPALLARDRFEDLKPLLDKSNYIILNEHEAKALSNKDDAIEACSYLADDIDAKIIVTLADKGCLYCYKDKKALIPAIDLSLFNLKAISTVGAGDTFAGAFASYLLRGFGEIESLFLANIAAALKIANDDPRGSPKHEQVMRYMNDKRMEQVYRRIRFI